jgi:aspartate aminotransferase/aminotransferase
MHMHWLAERLRHMHVSGIRKVFDLARSLKDPINLSIGQPDFDVPPPIKAAAIQAIEAGHNGYTVTQGIPALRERLEAGVRKRLGHDDRQLLITSGTSGGLVLALAAVLNPGDEVIIFDPYFALYPNAVALFEGRSVVLDTYPTFTIDPDRVKAAITPRTKAIIFCSPANPTGVVLSRDGIRALARLAQEQGILLISDEIYSEFLFEGSFSSAAEFNEDVLVLDGFSKTYGMTGWRLGYAHGPKALIERMAMVQQFTYVCAPSMVQHAGVRALEVDASEHVAAYRQKRDRMLAGLAGLYDVVAPGGAFYIFPRAPWGTGTDFCAECVKHNLLLIPGNTFSQRDTHFRISYAASESTLERGIEVLRALASRPDR